MICRSLVHVAALLAAAGLVNLGAAGAVPLDSSAFTHQYNGDVYLNPGLPNYTEAAGAWGTTPSSDGDILSFRSTVAGAKFFTSDLWTAASSDAAGWTVEFRIKIDDDFDEATNGAFSVFVGDGAVALSTVALQIGKNHVRTNTNVVLSNSINMDDFHTFRIAQVADSNEFLVWRDNAFLGSLAQGSHQLDLLRFGDDSSSGIGGPTVHLDYFRFDNTGGYEPVPEPAAWLMMLTLGAICLGSARRRRGVTTIIE